jgi:elongation factor G
MHANDREEIKEVRAGDIAAAVGLKDYTTGDTLTSPDKIITLEKMEFPRARYPRRGRAEDQSRPGKDGYGTQSPRAGRPVVPRAHRRRNRGQTIISGMGELHLEIIVDRMKREFGVEANVGAPQVAYRETIRKPDEKVEEASSSRQSGRTAASTVHVC